MFKVSDFDYELPKNLIAQAPAKPRDHSRLLVLHKDNGSLEESSFFEIVKYLKPNDVLVVNNSKVFPARLQGQKIDTLGKVEIFLVNKIKNNLWSCLVGGKVHEGQVIKLACGLQAKIKTQVEGGVWQVEFNQAGNKFMQTIFKIGQVPLPPYIKRNSQLKSDKKNYQTVYAASGKVGSVAAPTAGLHFTPRLLKAIKARGIKVLEVTLHVGLGTFAPVKVDNILEHQMHAEWIEIKKGVIKKIVQAKKNGQRIVAVGTTSCRVLESFGQSSVKADKDFSDWTKIFIYPGYQFKIVDALITNFHLPQSTLLMLVSALAGKDAIDKAYKFAVRHEYRFFSYGDAMFIC